MSGSSAAFVECIGSDARASEWHWMPPARSLLTPRWRCLPWHALCGANLHIEQGISGYRRQSMQLKEVITRNVEVIGPEATLEDAASRMEALEIGTVPVCVNDRLVAML